MKALHSLAAALLWSAAPLLAVDTAPPQVTSISVAPGSIDITTSPQTLSVTVNITDDESGFDFGNLNLYDTAGRFVTGAVFTSAERTAGDPLSGTYEVDVTVPRYVAPGSWRAEVLMLDFADNISFFGTGPGETAFPVPADAEFTVQNTGIVDATPSVVTAVTVVPDPVNTDGTEAEVTLTISTTDDLSGFSFGYIHLLGPDNGANSDVFGYFSPFERTSGDALSGTYVTTITLPEYSESGTWTVSVEVADVAGNRAFSTDTEFEVEGGTPPPPAPPEPGFLSQALDSLQLDFATSGSGWVHQTGDSADGLDAAVTRPVPDNGEAVMQTTVTGPGTLSFDWRVDSEELADFLSVEVGGGVSQEISGSTDWDTVSIAIPSGPQTIVWRYSKSGSGANGDDKGWVDRVRFLPAGPDAEAPRLQGLHLSSREANITEFSSQIAFFIKVSDDVNGFVDGVMRIFDADNFLRETIPFSASERTVGDEFSGVYEVVTSVETDWPLGKGRVEIELTEATTGATRIYSPAAESFPIPDSQIFHVVAGATSDTVPPKLRALDVTPRSVDVSSGPATVTVTVRVTDDGRGLSYGNVALLTPNDGYVNAYGFSASSETKYDGIYQVELEIPRYAEPGTWSLSSYLSDELSNDLEYPWNEDFAPGIDPSINVLNTGTADSTAPLVTSFAVAPGQIDTTAAAAPVEVTLTINEDISGLRDAYLFFYNPAGDYQPDLFALLDGSNRISGDNLAGTYRVTRMIPQGSPAGTWRVDVFLRDHTGNFRNYGPFGDALPGSGNFQVGTAPSLYQAFLATHSLSGNDALPGADPDRDGVNNVTELLLGTDPTDATESGNGLLVLSRDATHLHYDFTYATGLTATVNGLFLELRDGGGGAPLRLTGQTQNGLSGSWTNQLPILRSGRTWRISLPFASGPAGFMRLHFEDP